MEGKRRAWSMKLMYVMLLLRLCAEFQGFSSAANNGNSRNPQKQTIGRRTSAVLPLLGNVYPDGYYYVSVNIGQPPKPYFLDVDSGSDLSWVQCDAPCQNCMKSPHPPYKPKSSLVRCKDPLCTFLQRTADLHCLAPDEQCDYEVKYADHGSSLGVLIRDNFPLRFTNGSVLGPLLAFGCGYDQQLPSSGTHPFTDGVLGLGNGKSSIVSQLSSLGLTRNVVGHCLSSRGGGFLFFGDHIIPTSGISWAPLSTNSIGKHYSSGPAELLFGVQATGVKGLTMIFDSGSSYTYLNSQAYQATLSLMQRKINGKVLRDALEDKTLPVCWKGSKRFKSISNVKNYFSPLVLRFTNTNNVPLQIPPEGYLIITQQGNVCLGILNGTEVGLKHLNIVGGFSCCCWQTSQCRIKWWSTIMRNNGWDGPGQTVKEFPSPKSFSCNLHSFFCDSADEGVLTRNIFLCCVMDSVDRDYGQGFSQPYADIMGELEEHFFHQEL